jgi:hypothetical protein
MRWIFIWLLVSFILVTAALASASGRTVLFEDGRALAVEGVEIAGDTATLLLEGGGRIALPAERIANRDDLVGLSESKRLGPARNKRTVGKLSRGACAELIKSAARRHDLDPYLLMAMVEVGSSFDPSALSPRGAGGLMQLTPEIAERFGVGDVFDPHQNVEGGARYLSWLLSRYNGRVDLALAGYKVGVGPVDRYRGIPPYREISRYMDRVLERANRLAGRSS